MRAVEKDPLEDSKTRRLASLATVLLLAASCASAPKTPLAAPDWPAVPPAVLDALCARLRMDAIATGAPVSLVGTTRPLATQGSLSSLAYLARGRVKGDRVAQSVSEANRALPITIEGSACPWRRISPEQAARLHDEMVVELSAPAVNPFSPREGGLFVRVTIGGEHASWYWITLFPSESRWAVGGVSVLSP